MKRKTPATGDELAWALKLLSSKEIITLYSSETTKGRHHRNDSSSPEEIYESVTRQKSRPAMSEQKRKDMKSVDDVFGEYTVTEEYVSGLGQEKWLYPDLVISGHILVLIAMSGGGKTTFLFCEVAPYMAKNGATVYYIDADSPASEHKAMKAFADAAGFKFINPTTRIGRSIKDFVADLQKLVKSGADLTGRVFIFDTLKKFTDLMNKTSVKDFFSLCRSMNNLGATCVFSAHANKFRDKEGHLIPEGVGDVKNDTDDLILFERQPRPAGGINVTSVVDPDKGAKTRGLFKPFSFTITVDREIQHRKDVIDPVDYSTTRAPMATDEEILQAAEDLLREAATPIPKTTLSANIRDKIDGAGIKRIRRIITANAAKVGSCKRPTRFEYSIGPRGVQMLKAVQDE